MKRTFFLIGFAIIFVAVMSADLWTALKDGEITPVLDAGRKANAQAASSWKSRLVGQVELTGKEDLIGSLGVLAVTEDEWFVISDPKDTNIKLFDAAGKFVKSWGRKGQGPGEFETIGVMSYKKPFLIVPDSSRRAVQIFERKAPSDFQRIYHITNIPVSDPRRRFDIYKDNLLVDEVIKDKQGIAYHLYLKGMTSSDPILIMPWAIRYGMDTKDDFMAKHSAFAELGLGMSFFDVVGDDAYYAWEGEMRIIKINLKSKTWAFFGKETKNYIRPDLSDRQSHRPAEGRYSRIFGVYADESKVLLGFANPNPDWKRLKVFFQVYDLNGVFLGEIPFSDSAEFADILRYVYHRQSGSIFVPITIVDEKGIDVHFVVKKYRITQ